jgi:putative peptidoglycan lipid II flippase
MNRILSIFHKEIAGVHQAAFLLGTFTLMSQLLALVRDRMLANFFGATQTLDLYYTAFRIPDLIYASVASLVSISVLIPFFSGVFEKNKDEARRLLNSIFTGFLGIMIAVSVLAFILMPYIVRVFFSNLGGAEAMHDLTLLSRLLLLQPICLGISNVFGVITQISKRFFLYALSPILYNLSIIFGLVFLYPAYGMRGVVYGVIIGGVMHFLIQVPFVYKEGLLPRITFNFDFKILWNVIKISIPRTITLSGNMLELIIITSFASWLVAGSVSVLNLALNLQSVPFAIVGVSYALAAFPVSLLCKGGTREVHEPYRHCRPSRDLLVCPYRRIVHSAPRSDSANYSRKRVIQLAAHSPYCGVPRSICHLSCRAGSRAPFYPRILCCRKNREAARAERALFYRHYRLSVPAADCI